MPTLPQQQLAWTGAGLSRREWLYAGGLGLTGLSLADLFRGTAQAATSGARRPCGFGRAKSCVIVFLKGGPSHHDTFDMKPDAPSEIRGPFRPISTSVPGFLVCEHLSRLARHVDKLAVVRSLYLKGGAAHSTAAYEVTTGHAFMRPGEAVASREDQPHYGSSVALADGGQGAAPPYVMVPQYLTVNGEFRGGQYAGLLGSRYDPLVPGADPNGPNFRPANLGLVSPVEPERAGGRRVLLGEFNARLRSMEAAAASKAYDQNYQRAFALLDSGRTRQAFDVAAEPLTVRERYGRNQFGQSVLLARRLVEAGVRLVHVNCMSTIVDSNNSWDTHSDNFNKLKNLLLPRADRAVSALLDDLADRGLLDETLVVMVGEFGRTPKINASAGRDHWPFCFSVQLAGAGMAGGAYVGASDKSGAYPRERPVLPGHVAATIFHALGIDPATDVRTIEGRPYRIAEEQPILELWS